MFQRFTPNLIRTITFAQEEALGLGRASVAPEHLLLGLIRLSDDKAANLLRRANITLPAAVRELETLTGRGNEQKSGDIPLDLQAEQLLRSAWEQSQAARNAECGTEHLLMSLLSGNYTAVGKVLAALGAKISVLEVDVTKLLQELDNSTDDQEQLKSQISVWHNRAEMAQKQGNADLAQKALEEKNRYQKLLDER